MMLSRYSVFVCASGFFGIDKLQLPEEKYEAKEKRVDKTEDLN